MRRFLVVVLLSSFFLAACGRSNVTSKEDVDQTVAMQQGIVWESTTVALQKNAKRQSYDVAKMEYATYVLQTENWEIEDKELFIRDIESFLRELSVVKISEPIEINVGDDLYTQFWDKKIILSKDKIGDISTYWNILLAYYDADVDFCEAYGNLYLWYSDKYGIDEINNEDEIISYISKPENQYLLNFHLPMFEDFYFDLSKVDIEKKLAVMIIKDNHNEADFNNCFNNIQDTDIENWLNKNTIPAEYKYEKDIVYKRNFGNSREDYPYYIDGQCGRWLFANEDIDSNNYDEIITNMIHVDEIGYLDFQDARVALADYIDDVKEIEIKTSFHKPREGVAAYYKSDCIYLTSDDWGNIKMSFLHEYVHHLTMGEGKMFSYAVMMNEAFAEVISRMECINRLSEEYYKSLEEFERHVEKYDFWNGENNQECMDYIYTLIAFCFINHMADGNLKYLSLSQVYGVRDENITLDSLSYQEGAELLLYLIETYGRKEAFEACQGIDEMNRITGKSFDELFEDFSTWLNEKYASYDKYQL